jgi:hypothetical protein
MPKERDVCQFCEKPIDFDVDCQVVVDMGDFITDSCKWVHSDCLEDYEMESCDICGEYHDKDSVPITCESGDGL